MYLTFAFFQLKGSHGARAVRCCKYEISLQLSIVQIDMTGPRPDLHNHPIA
jgi:hypothetical protein